MSLPSPSPKHSPRKSRPTPLLRVLLALFVLCLLIGIAFWLFRHFTPPAESQTPSPPELDTLRALGNKEPAIYAGIPNGPPSTRLLRNQAFLVGYDESRRNPAWVAYRVEGPANHQSLPRPSSFQTDTRTSVQVRHEDYTNSGYDRGHMAPNYAIYSRFGATAQRETFLMSNVAPQTPSLNRGRWRELEARIAGQGLGDDCWAVRYGPVWVVMGPLYTETPATLPSGVTVPDAFFKVVIHLDAAKVAVEVLAFILPNTASNIPRLEDCLVSVDEIETASGLNLLWELEDALENAIESQKAQALWN